ncbi:MAG: hypothetical protein ABDH59_06010, partial [Fervidobacterium sp.]
IIRNSWSVLSYTDPLQTWNSGYMINIGKAVQQEKIQADSCTIERIFVLDDAGEEEKLKNRFEEQKNIGVIVKKILKKKVLEIIERDSEFKRLVKRYNTLDIAVADDEWVYMTLLDVTRKVNGAMATKDKDTLTMCKRLFLEVKKEAQEV